MAETLLESLKNRDLLAQKRPVIKFNFPDDDKPQIIVEAKRLSAVERRKIQGVTVFSQEGDTENLSEFYRRMFEKVLPHVVSIKTVEGTDMDVKEMTTLMRKHFGAGEAVNFGLQYQLALVADENEAIENPNE